MVYERSINEHGRRKGNGVCKIRRARRYKYDYKVDKRKIYDYILLEKLNIWKVIREEDEVMKNWKEGRETESVNVISDGRVKDIDGYSDGGRNGSLDIPSVDGLTDGPSCYWPSGDGPSGDGPSSDGPSAEESELENGDREEEPPVSRHVARAKGIFAKPVKPVVRRRRRGRVDSKKFRLHVVVARPTVDSKKLPSL